MHTRLEQENGKAIIKLSGRFDFNSHREFRGSYESALDNAQLRELVIDLSGVDYLDSSALGMLLLASVALLRQYFRKPAHSPQGGPHIVRDRVREMLQLAHELLQFSRALPHRFLQVLGMGLEFSLS